MVGKEAIASQVSMKVKLHKMLEFRHELPENMSEENTLLTKELGNVTEQTEQTFEYRIKRVVNEEERWSYPQVDNGIPFQTQITYTKLNGMKCLRTITAVQEVSHNKKEVQDNIWVNVLATNACQQAAWFADQKNYRQAQAYSVA